MNQINLKTHYTAQELADMRLPGLPETRPGIVARAKTNAWDSRARSGRGGGNEYSLESLPTEAQEALREKIYQQVLATKTNTTPTRASKCGVSKPRTELNLMRQCPALLDREVSALTEKQKLIADARAALAMEVEKLRDAGMSRTAAVNYVSNASRNGTLPEHLLKAVELANARKGSRTGVGTRSLQEWLSVFESTKSGGERLAMLAPGHLKAKKPEQISWLPDFLAHWRSLNGPSMREAYRGFCKQWQVVYAGQPEKLDACPSYDAVRRAMVKLPRREKALGRVSGSAKLAYETYQKRDWSTMPVNGCWVSDGKSLDLVARHPVHGQPFTPELTLVLDGRTRYCVGWSLRLSESMDAVLDAYRYGMQHHGKPLFVYSDNGGGEANKTFDDKLTGIFPRMGITHMTSIPGRPQSRGLIERLNAVIPHRLGQRFETFNGRGADRENVRMTNRAIQSAIRAEAAGRELTARQKKDLSKLPTWQRLLDVIAEEVDAYNNEHEHSELPRRNGRHMTPAAYRKMVLEQEGDEIEYLTDVELREVLMAEIVRVAQQGWISLMNNDYFSQDLINVDKEEVRVAYDIHDASEVIIRRMDGTYVCHAVWNGNKRDAIPVSKMQDAMKQRTKRRLGLLDKKREEVEAEARGLLPGSVVNELPDFGSFIPKIVDEPEPEYFFLATDREEHLKKAGNHK
ncbi:Mu transposase C-terminal domain-containing protein [Klebsiella pneumoniae]|uniref:Mu transposase C-terminal domain-containing protein n=1 Tax=Klebsiella pneumoniae TaxID=573 RepID=UPI000DE6EE43|nr:Mu transposase C-terminal domain-containing protein [Klebsiella pneumoniae]SSG52094.1 Mu transposase, C-terminal [Klebsiella pneumoniae]